MLNLRRGRSELEIRRQQGSSELGMKGRAAEDFAVNGAQSGPFIGNRKEDKHEKRPGDELGKRRSENGDDIGFSTAASEVARWGGLGMAWRGIWCQQRRRGGGGALVRGAWRRRRLWGGSSSGGKLAEVEMRGAAGGGAAWEEGKAPARGGVGPGRAQGSSGAPTAAEAAGGREKPAATAADRAPADLEVGDELGGLVCKR